MMYVDVGLATAGPVAHDPRPGDHGLQPGVALTVPRSALRRVHGPGTDRAQDTRAAVSGTSSGGWRERYLPPEVLARKKQGFASPLMYILNDEVRRLAPRLLHGSELVRDGYLRGRARRASWWSEHLEGRRDHGNRIWLLLTAEVWYRHFIGRRSAEDLEAELAEAGGGAAPRVAAAASQR